MKNNRHFGYPEKKITNFKILGTRLETTLHHCRLILETETEPGTKSRFHYLCLGVGPMLNDCIELWPFQTYTTHEQKHWASIKMYWSV